MAIVTIVEGASARPPFEMVDQMAEALMPELVGMWVKKHETFIAGKRFWIMASPRGEYSPIHDGPIRDSTLFTRAAFPVAFSLTDDPDAAQSAYCLKVMEPDPNMVPDGVSSGDEPITVHYEQPDE